jgi:hypothetical protein
MDLLVLLVPSLGCTANPTPKIVATAIMAPMKIVLFIVK